jgi:hypothetical protein
MKIRAIDGVASVTNLRAFGFGHRVWSIVRK